MKPIFEQERVFLQEKLGIELPQNCWRDACKIYLNSDKESLILRFKVEQKKLVITKNVMEKVLKTTRNKTLEEEIRENNDRLNELERESIEKTKEYIHKYHRNEIRVSYSGGKDSDVMWHILKKVFKDEGIEDYVIDFYNTTNDTAQTYLHVKNDLPQDHLQIHNPDKGWYQWLIEKEYYLPSVTVRNCCSTYKEGKVREVLDIDVDYIIFLGARKYESTKRSEYDWDLNEAWKKSNPNKALSVPYYWRRFLPIVNFTDVDVWLYILREGILINKMYELGFSRTGCLLCPYSTEYNDLLIERHYPKYWERWTEIVSKNYERYDVRRRLKWTKDEYINEGKWKRPVAKEHEIISRKPTAKRIKEIADLKGVSEEIAAKFFQKVCRCNKKLNSDEIAMFLKITGIYEGVDDSRQYLCKNCMCEELNITKDQYAEKVREFREGGCNLF